VPTRNYARDQVWLMPPSLGDLVPTDHVARFVAGFVDALNFTELGLVTQPGRMGAPSYPARALITAWIYGFMTRTRSSRTLETAIHERVPLMWLMAGLRPDHSTLARFFQDNHKVIAELYRKTVHVAIDTGLVDFALQAIDGTKVSALSKDKTLSRPELEALLKRVDETVQHVVQTVQQELAPEAPAPSTPHLPAELQDAQQLRARIQAALAEITAREAERKSDVPAADPQASAPQGPKVHLADPEAVTMKGRHGFVTGYNAQAAVDSAEGVIVAAEAVADPTDSASLVPMLDAIQGNTGRLAQTTTADSGYHSADNLEALAQRPTTAYIADPKLRGKRSPQRWAYHKDHFVYDRASDTYTCPAGQRLTYAFTQTKKHYGNRKVRVYACHDCQNCPHAAECTPSAKGRRIRVTPQDALLQAHRERLGSEPAKQAIRRRGAVIECVFGILREHLGLNRFLRRGLDNVRAEWKLLCAAFNLHKLYHHWRCAMAAPALA